MSRLNFEVRVYCDRLTARDWLAIAKRIAKTAKGRRKDCEAAVYCADESVITKHDGTFNHYKK